MCPPPWGAFLARCYFVIVTHLFPNLTTTMIDLEQVKKVAHLARLELTPAEEAQFPAQLNGILDYFEQLSELDTEGVPPTTRAIEVSNISRHDEMAVYGDRDRLLEAAPEREEDFFRVPQILSTDED